jgi:hypothetical protein
MKKLGFLLFFCLTSILAFAQADRYSGYSGVKVGLNLSNLSGTFLSPTTKLKMKPGLYAGIYVNQEITKRVGMRLELGYNQQGALVEESILVHNDYTINFFEATPMITMRLFPLARQNRFMLVAGPTFNLLSHAKFYKENFNGAVKQVVYGATFGVNYLIHGTDNFWFSFDARYNLGISDIMRENTMGNALTLRNVHFGFGFGFPINRFHILN